MSDDRTPLAGDALNVVLALAVALQDDMTEDLADRGLTRSRSHVVWLLGAEGPATQRAIARALGVSARNVTGLVDALVDTGFVTREPHPTDRRATHVTLTDRGRRAAAELRDEHAQLAGQLFGDVPHDRLAALTADLAGVLGRVEELVAARRAGGAVPPGGAE